MTNTKWYPIIYVFVLMFIFSSAVIGITNLTSERVKTNEMIAVEKAIIEVLPGLFRDGMQNTEIHKIYSEKVSKPSRESGGAYFTGTGEKSTPTAFAVPFAGRGFWAPIKGFIGIAGDKKTITGISFYEQSETPGLGAEIVKAKFKDQFKGKILAENGKHISFKRTGEQISDNEVESVTGATQTCTRLEKIINNALNEWKQKMTSSQNEKY